MNVRGAVEVYSICVSYKRGLLKCVVFVSVLIQRRFMNVRKAVEACSICVSYKLMKVDACVCV